MDGEHLLLLATTLDKLILGTRPFWGGKSGPVRISTVPYPVPSILRWLLPLMYGGENRSAPVGARSFSGHVFEIATKTPFVIDGEFFEGPDEGPLRLETGPRVVQPRVEHRRRVFTLAAGRGAARAVPGDVHPPVPAERDLRATDGTDGNRAA